MSAGIPYIVSNRLTTDNTTFYWPSGINPITGNPIYRDLFTHSLDRLFLASPKKDCAVLEQSLGRISRSFPGKKDAICYDYADRRIGICIGLYKHRFNTYQKMKITIRSGGVDTSTVGRSDGSALSRLFPSPTTCFIPEPEKPLYTPGYTAAV